jgi:hypothetical protein
MQTTPFKRELIIAALLFGFGFLVLPFAIYWVGSELIGEYAPGGNALTLAERIWTDFIRLEPVAWILVLSPYAALMLVRLTRRAWLTRSV